MTVMEVSNEFIGRRIKFARVKAGLTQGELGGKLDPIRSDVAIGYMEKGKSRVYLVDILRIAELTDQSVTFFMDPDVRAKV